MKIAVYSIAKNEEQFVRRWSDSCIDADYRIILDTGSVDQTVQIARDAGVTVETKIFTPWRFDHARNESLSLVPADVDYCVALDMDEVLLPGWRSELERSFLRGATRPRYKYTWSWNDDGSPGLQYGGDKIHARHGYVWKHPVHEVLTCVGDEFQDWCDLEIHHYPDQTKSRGQYFPLLELAVSEDPEDDRNSHYLAREYYYQGMLEKASVEFRRHLLLAKSVWKPERAQSMRYLAKCEPDNQEMWLWRAANESPDRREPWVDLAKMYYERQMWTPCLFAAQKAIEIVSKPLEYLCDQDAWGALPWDLAALAAFNLGQYALAVEYGKQAVIFENSERLNMNLAFYLERAKSL